MWLCPSFYPDLFLKNYQSWHFFTTKYFQFDAPFIFFYRRVTREAEKITDIKCQYCPCNSNKKCPIFHLITRLFGLFQSNNTICCIYSSPLLKTAFYKVSRKKSYFLSGQATKRGRGLNGCASKEKRTFFLM